MHFFYFLMERGHDWKDLKRKDVARIMKDNFGVAQGYYRMANINRDNLRIELLCEAEGCG